MKKQRELKKVVLLYDDGTSEDIHTGMVVSTTTIEDKVNVSMNMCNMSGDAVESYLECMIEVYAQLKGIE